MQLGQILVRKKLVSQEQLDRGLGLMEVRVKRIGELLCDQRAISDTQLQDALKEQEYRQSGFWVID